MRTRKHLARIKAIFKELIDNRYERPWAWSVHDSEHVVLEFDSDIILVNKRSKERVGWCPSDIWRAAPDSDWAYKHLSNYQGNFGNIREAYKSLLYDEVIEITTNFKDVVVEIRDHLFTWDGNRCYVSRNLILEFLESDQARKIRERFLLKEIVDIHEDRANDPQWGEKGFRKCGYAVGTPHYLIES